MKSNTFNHAQSELSILVNSAEPDNRPLIEPFIDEILALVDKFGKSGQSGGSAPYTASALSHAIKQLCLQEPICPITGIEQEWVDVAHLCDEGKDVLYQNARCGALFKNSDGAYYLNAICWKTQNDSTWTGSAILPNGEKILSRQFVNFPFEPKTFVIDVIEKEIAPDDWEFYVKDESQLNEVFEYYRK